MNSCRKAFALTTKVISFFCLLMLFAGPAMAADYVSIKNNEVNVRSGPATDKPVRWEVFQGFPLRVLERKDGWAQCLDFEGDKGWIYESLLSSKKTVIVKKDKVNLRDKPSTGNDARVVALVKYGVVFEAVAKDGEWLKVKHSDGTVGWIHKGLVWPEDPLD